MSVELVDVRGMMSMSMQCVGEQTIPLSSWVESEKNRLLCWMGCSTCMERLTEEAINGCGGRWVTEWEHRNGGLEAGEHLWLANQKRCILGPHCRTKN